MEITTKDLVEVEDFPGYYIDKEGNIYNKKLLKLTQSIFNTHVCVYLKKNGNYRRTRVDKLLAKAFIPNPNGYTRVAHKNGNNSDIHIENLYWSNLPVGNFKLSPLIAFECFDEDGNYVASFSINQIRKHFDVNSIKQAAKSQTLYENYYWRAIKSVNELCVPLSENIDKAVYMISAADMSSTRNTINKVMKKVLSARQQEIINLYFFEEYTALEISRMLNISKAGIYEAIKYSLYKMRNCKELRNLYER